MSRLLVIACLIGLSVPSHARSPDARLADLRERAPDLVAEMAAPLAACVTRRDTPNPVFHGCGGWARSVQALWALVSYSAVTGDGRYAPLIQATLAPQALRREWQQMNRYPEANLPYGGAWLLRLATDYGAVFGDDRLDPLARSVVVRLRTRYRGDGIDPDAGGEASDALGLLFLYNHAVEVGDRPTASVAAQAIGRALVPTDRACRPPPGPDGAAGEVPVCLMRALAAGRVMDAPTFAAWLDRMGLRAQPRPPLPAPVGPAHASIYFSTAAAAWQVWLATGEDGWLTVYLDFIEAGLTQWRAQPPIWSADHVPVYGILALLPLFAPAAGEAG